MVLSDDAFRRILRKFDRKKSSNHSQDSASVSRPPPAPAAPEAKDSGMSSSDSEASEVDEPPPVVQPPPSLDRSRSRSGKRGASSALVGPKPKK